MTVRDQDRRPLSPQRRPAGRMAMLISGFLAGLVVATAVGVVLLGMRLATVGQAEEVIEAPTPSVTESTGDAATESPTAGSTESPTSAATQPAPSTGDGSVPESCVLSAEYSLAVDVSLDQLALGARDEDAKTVQEALDVIQEARVNADGAAEECLDLAGRSGTP